jgi:uncharacterized membrane protein YbaN (DUF454 family)
MILWVTFSPKGLAFYLIRDSMTLIKVVFTVTGFVLFALGIAGIILPILPATPFLLAAFFCFLKSSPCLYRWIMANHFLGLRITRISDAGLTAKEKISIYLFVCALIMPVIILIHIPASADIPDSSSGNQTHCLFAVVDERC